MQKTDTPSRIPQSINESAFTAAAEHLTAAAECLNTASREKYDLKTRLIENASDMSTQQKLDALDQNYDRHCLETWQNVIIIGTLSFALAGLLTGNPAVLKNIRRLAA